MKIKPMILSCLAAFILLLPGALAWADQIILKDGTVYSGKFIRGDSNTVDFRVLGRVESFKVTDISRIVFKEPELEIPANTQATVASSAPVQREPSPPEPEPKIQVLSPVPTQRSTPTSPVTMPEGTPVTIRTSAEINTEINKAIFQNFIFM